MRMKLVMTMALSAALMMGSVTGCGNKEAAVSETTVSSEATACKSKDTDIQTEIAPSASEGFILTPSEITAESISQKNGETGRIGVPRTSYDLYVNIEDSYYKIAMNTNECFFPVELMAINDKVNKDSSSVDFAVLDENWIPQTFSFSIEDHRVFDRQPENFNMYTYGDWEFGVVDKGFSGNGYLALDNGYYLEIDFLDILKDRSEEVWKKLMEAVSASFKAEKLGETGPDKIMLPDRFSAVKLSDKFALNLVDQSAFAFNRWVIVEKHGININWIRLMDESGKTAEIAEYPSNTTVEDIKQTIFSGDSYQFKTYSYGGIDMELVTDDVFNGQGTATLLMDLDGRDYQVVLQDQEIMPDSDLGAILDRFIR